MKRVFGKDLIHHVGKKVCLRGWLNNVRSFGKIHFLILRDASGFSQIVIEESREFQKIAHLQAGSVLKIIGTPVKSQEAALEVELTQPQIEVEVPIQEVCPVEYYKPEIPSDFEFVLDHRPLSLRNREIQAIFKIQAELTHAFRLFMHDEARAVEYFGPNIIGASSEGGAEFFNVDYFGYSATLAQSSQLTKQMMVGVYERVFALMPFFRAEPSHTTRHLSEGKQFEFEMGFFDHWHEIMDLQENCMKFIHAYLKNHCKEELKILKEPLIQCPPDVAFPRLTFLEAQELFYQRTGIDERNEPDLSPAAERELCAWALLEKGTEFVFVTDWKVDKRPFYAYPNDENPELTNTFDLLCRGVEITSGGQRRHSYESMVEGIKMKEMDPENFTDYLSIFKYGMPPHGGFGIGLERLTMTLVGLKNIRQASLFPSDTKRIAGVRIKSQIFFGGENIRNEIIRLLRKQDLSYEHLTHAPTPTSDDSSKIRETKPEEGIKSLILKGKTSKKNYQFNIPSHLKIDMKAVQKITGEKCEFENPTVIQERYGLIIGGVPPFGNLLNIDNYFDESLKKEKRAAFNCGLSTESILVATDDLARVADPIWENFTKTE